MIEVFRSLTEQIQAGILAPIDRRIWSEIQDGRQRIEGFRRPALAETRLWHQVRIRISDISVTDRPGTVIDCSSG